MAATFRSYAKRRYEDRLVETIECFDCGAPRGWRCQFRGGREAITCCQARDDFGRPILQAQMRFRLMLAEVGVAEWPWGEV